MSILFHAIVPCPVVFLYALRIKRHFHKKKRWNETVCRQFNSVTRTHAKANFKSFNQYSLVSLCHLEQLFDFSVSLRPVACDRHSIISVFGWLIVQPKYNLKRLAVSIACIEKRKIKKEATMSLLSTKSVYSFVAMQNNKVNNQTKR